MREHGILFQDEMVRALLRQPGDPLRKTVTRRTSDQWAKRKVGDLLWVRECWGLLDAAVLYRSSDDVGPQWKWRPSILMPRWASRLTLRVVSLRQERGTPYPSWSDGMAAGDPPHPGLPLPWVDDADARREGVEDRAAYLRLWESINGDVYPTWVWRIEFEEVSRG